MPEAIVRLAQACLRVADLSFMQRFPSIGIIQEDFEEFLEQSEMPYETGVKLPGKFGKDLFDTKAPRFGSCGTWCLPSERR